MNDIDITTVKFFADIIAKNTGIIYSDTNIHMLEKRLKDLSLQLGFAQFQDLWQEVRSKGLSDKAKSLLLDLATNNETSFFRDPEVFHYVRDVFLRQQLPLPPGVPLSIWCAACSTGQEPYSLAMVLGTQIPQVPYQILATDISDRVLQIAKTGVYTELEVNRGMNSGELQRFFEPHRSENSVMKHYKVKREIAQHIQFKKLNLLDAWPSMGPFHLVLCRNVLIYQNVENKKKIINRIAQLLHPKGVFILGGAESMLGLSEDFKMEIHGKACVYKLAKGE